MELFHEQQDGEEAGRLWLARIHATIKWREEHWNADRAWRRAQKLDRGDHWDTTTPDPNDDASSESPRDRITVNMTGSMVRDFLAFLFKHTPKFLMRPRRAEGVPDAKIQQSLVNYYWREKNWKKQARRAARDMIMLGTGIVKTGWVFELDAAKQPDKDGLIEYHDAVRLDEPFVRRISPFRFLIDPEAPEFDLESARWVAEAVHKPLNDVLVNERYDAKVRNKILAGKYTPAPVKSPLDSRTGQSGDATGQSGLTNDEVDALRLVRLFEVWDKKFKRYYVIADGVPEPLIASGWPYNYLDGFPYVMGVFDELNDELYGQGLPMVMEDQQYELNRIRTGEFIHRRNFGSRKWSVLEGTMDPTEVLKLQTGDDGTVVKVKSHEAIKAIENPPLPQDNYRVEESIKEDIRLLTGADQLTQGGNLPSRTSATEINARQQYTGLKIDSRVEAVDEFLTNITRQVLQHLKANLRVAQVLEVEGTDGKDWVTATPEAVRAEADLEIVTVSAERDDEATLRQQAQNAAQTLLQNAEAIQMAGFQLNVPVLLKWWLGERMGVKEIDNFLLPAPPPPPQQPGAEGSPAGPGGPQAMPGPMPPQQVALQEQAVAPESLMQGPMGSLGG